MHQSAPALLALLALLSTATPASAETLRCRAFNGNVTCAGDGAASCQTIDGRTVCSSGHGAVMQSFGGPPPDDGTPPPPDDAAAAEQEACGLANSAAGIPGAASRQPAPRTATRSSPPCAWLSQP